MTNPLLARYLELYQKIIYKESVYNTLNNIIERELVEQEITELKKEYESIKSQLESLLQDGEKWRKLNALRIARGEQEAEIKGLKKDEERHVYDLAESAKLIKTLKEKLRRFEVLQTSPKELEIELSQALLDRLKLEKYQKAIEAINKAQEAENLRIDKHFHVEFACRCIKPDDPEFAPIAAQCRCLERIKKGLTPLHNLDLITAGEVCGRRNRYPEQWGAGV